MSASMSSSTSSLADSNYDMVDDASEISNDDRDTASLHSTDHHESDEGAITPEDSGSVVDVEEEHAQDLEDSEPTAIPEEGSFETLPATHDTVKEENTLLDSYMNDELETPKQSVLHRGGDFPLSDSIISTSSTSSDGTDVQSMTTLNVLFVSDDLICTDTMVKLFQKLALDLSANKDAVSQFEFQVLKMPPTSGNTTSRPILLLRFRDIELVVYHCKNADEQATDTPSYALQFATDISYQTQTQVYTADGKGYEQTPDLVVFLVGSGGYPYWFSVVKKAMAPRFVPVVSIGRHSLTLGGMSHTDKAAVDEGSHLVITDADSLGGKKVRRDLQALLSSKLPTPKTPASKPSTSQNSIAKPPLTEEVPAATASKSKSPGGFPVSRLIKMVVFSVAWALAYCAFTMLTTSTPVDTLAVRREALSTALDNVVNTTDATKLFSLNQLLPPDQVMNGTYEGFVSGAKSVQLDPNHIIVATPRKNTTRRYVQPSDIRVYRSGGRITRVNATTVIVPDGPSIDFNITKLISGVYHVAFDPNEAYGTIVVNMQLKNRYVNITASHNFGMRSFHRTTTDVTKAVTKDISLARQRVRSFKQKLGMELSAGAAATGNVTSELALYAARDVQVLANTALSVFRSTLTTFNGIVTGVNAGGHNALAIVETGIGNIKGNIQNIRAATRKSSTVARSSTKKTVRSALIASRDVAMGLKSKITGRAEEIANSTSATKELSLRLQNFWNPTEKTKRGGGLADIARCVGSEDYAACRKAYRMLEHAPMTNRVESKLIEVAPQAEKAVQVSPDVAAKATEAKKPALEKEDLWQRVKKDMRAEKARWRDEKAVAKAAKAGRKAAAKAAKVGEKAAKKQKMLGKEKQQDFR